MSISRLPIFLPAIVFFILSIYPCVPKKHDQTNDLFQGAAITIFDLLWYICSLFLFIPRFLSLPTHSHITLNRSLGVWSDCEFRKIWYACIHYSHCCLFFMADCQKRHLWRVCVQKLTYLHWKTIRTGKLYRKSYLWCALAVNHNHLSPAAHAVNAKTGCGTVEKKIKMYSS